MAENGQTAVAWEMLSSVVVMRAKARENKLPKLLSSLHGVEVELARIIAGADAPQDAGINGHARSHPAAVAAAAGRQIEGFSEMEGIAAEPAARSRSGRRSGNSRSDQQLRAHAKKYLSITKQLKELVERGEAVATGEQFGDAFESDWEASSDALLADQHDLTFTIANLKATTFEGLLDKASVLDDLIEENTDDPVQVLARSLARDVVTMGQSRKAGR